MTMQKWGGAAALVAATTYLVGFALLTTVLAPAGYASAEPNALAVVDFLAGNSALMFAWNLTIYVINAAALVVLAVALSERFKADAAGLSQMALAFGTLWATLVLGAGMVANVGLAEITRLYATAPERAAEVWHMLHLVENGLGGGNEIAGGLWAIVLGLGGMTSRSLPRALSVFALVIGVAGLSTVVPALGEIGGAIFGLGFIAWFGWAGVTLLGSIPASRAVPA